MIISKKYKFIYIHIPRTSGSSIERMLSNYLDSNDIYIPEGEGHLTIDEIKDKLDTKEYFKFTFVRNPWDRFVSSYSFAKVINSYIKPISCPDLQGFDSFESTITLLQTFDLLKKNLLFYPQTKWINKDDKVAIDYIARYENLDEELKELCKRCGIKYTPIPHLRKSNHKHYKEYYNDETKKIVQDFYKEDIDMFEYKF